MSLEFALPTTKQSNDLSFISQMLESEKWKTIEYGSSKLINAAYRVIKEYCKQYFEAQVVEENEHQNISLAFDAILQVAKEIDYTIIDFVLVEYLFKAKSVFRLMPIPQAGDSKYYAELYYTIDLMIRGNVLAHRMAVSGHGRVNKIGYNYGGSFGMPMLSEMSASMLRFFTTHSAEITSILEEVNSRGMIMEFIESEFKSTLHMLKNVHERAQQGKAFYLPVSIKDKEDRHVISVAISNTLCLVGDRANLSKAGVEVFEIQAQDHAIEHTVRALSQRKNDRSFEDVMNCLRANLNLPTEASEHIPFPLQVANNCTWASGALNLAFSIFYISFVQVSKLDKSTARKLATQCYNAWYQSDEMAALDSYLEYCALPEVKAYGPDKLLLSKILISRSHQDPNYEKIRSKLRSSEHLTDSSLKDAYCALLNDIKGFVTKLKLAEPVNSETCLQLADRYIIRGNIEFETVRQLIFGVSSSFTPQFSATKDVKLINNSKNNREWIPSDGIEQFVKAFI